MPYRNEYEFRVFSIKRSGNHAIISWLASLFNEPVYYFNQCDLDPFRTQSPPPKIHDDIQYIFKDVNNMFRWNEGDIQSIRELNKKCLIHSYENKEIDIFQDCINNNIDRNYITGNSKNKFDIIILRDFHNFVASTISIRYNDVLSSHINKFMPENKEKWLKDSSKIWTVGYERALRRVELWKNYAKEFIGQTNYLENRLSISFNKWFVDETYRKNIANILGLSYSDITLNYIMKFGHGSSFSNLSKDGEATKLNVLNRWKIFKDNDIYWDIINVNKEVLELSHQIFGRTLEE